MSFALFNPVLKLTFVLKLACDPVFVLVYMFNPAFLPRLFRAFRLENRPEACGKFKELVPELPTEPIPVFIPEPIPESTELETKFWFEFMPGFTPKFIEPELLPKFCPEFELIFNPAL